MRLLLLVCAVAAVAWAKPSSHYTDKFDRVNIDEILESSRLLKSYIDCLMERGRCTPDAKELRHNLPDGLENECSKCTEKQKENTDKVIRHLVNKRPDLWEELSSKYDPQHIYAERYKDKVDVLKEST